jgi:hypothetical protein
MRTEDQSRHEIVGLMGDLRLSAVVAQCQLGESGSVVGLPQFVHRIGPPAPERVVRQEPRPRLTQHTHDVGEIERRRHRGERPVPLHVAVAAQLGRITQEQRFTHLVDAWIVAEQVAIERVRHGVGLVEVRRERGPNRRAGSFRHVEVAQTRPHPASLGVGPRTGRMRRRRLRLRLSVFRCRSAERAARGGRSGRRTAARSSWHA